jgi:hypothetical protein
MKIKKKLIILAATIIMAFSVSPFALADNDAMGIQTQTQTQTTELTNSKYLTKGGAAFWFIFTIVANVAISFWIGNRFYRLSKKDNHVSSEIRALRKDVEEKFVKSVGGFAEQEVDISNLNESLAVDEEGIKPVEKQPVFREVSAEEEERFRKWEEAQSKPKSERVRPKSAVKEELDGELNDVKKIRRKNYQPDRSRKADTDEKSGEDLEATREVKLKGEGVKSKAKEILGDIFPFKED